MRAQVFEQELTIKEQHLDTFGHVNNAVYLQIFEQARWDIISAGGYGMETIREKGQGPVILEAHLKFLHEVRNRQQVCIRSTITEYRGKVGSMRQTLLDSDGRECCDASFVFGLWDIRARKLVPPTQEWLAALGIEAR